MVTVRQKSVVARFFDILIGFADLLTCSHDLSCPTVSTGHQLTCAFSRDFLFCALQPLCNFFEDCLLVAIYYVFVSETIWLNGKDENNIGQPSFMFLACGHVSH